MPTITDADSLREVEPNIQGLCLLNLSRYKQKKILSQLKTHEIQNFLHYMDPDDLTDLLQVMSERRKKYTLDRLDDNLKEKVEFLLKFNPRTAAGLMSLDYVQVHKNYTFQKVFTVLKKHEKRTGKTPEVLVVENGYLVGMIPQSELLFRKKAQKITRYIKRMPTIRFDRDEKEVVKRFKSHRHNRIAVLDDDNSILGVIYSDDVLRIIEKPAGDLYDFAGVADEEDVHDSVFVKVKHRYKWLILNLMTGFLAAGVVSIFRDTISAMVLLAVYMPVVAGLGGNAGTQTLAVTVRGLSLKEIELKTGGKVIANEMLAGGINGIIVGFIVAMVATFWNQSPYLGLAIGMAMVINLMIAGFFGSIVPLVMKYLKNDPATSATVFITTATDICGFFVFLGLASTFL